MKKTASFIFATIIFLAMGCAGESEETKLTDEEFARSVLSSVVAANESAANLNGTTTKGVCPNPTSFGPVSAGTGVSVSGTLTLNMITCTYTAIAATVSFTNYVFSGVAINNSLTVNSDLVAKTVSINGSLALTGERSGTLAINALTLNSSGQVTGGNVTWNGNILNISSL